VNRKGRLRFFNAVENGLGLPGHGPVIRNQERIIKIKPAIQVFGQIAESFQRDSAGQSPDQTILNADDPMVPCIGQFQPVITTTGDPTSELLAELLREMLDTKCRNTGVEARVVRIRVWESDTCCAEIRA